MADFLGKNITSLQRLVTFAQSGGVSFVTLAANLTMTLKSPHLQFIDPADARDVTLPATNGQGCIWVIVNTADAAETITVKDPAGNTVKTIAQNAAGLFGTDGTTYDGVSFTIAL